MPVHLIRGPESGCSERVYDTSQGNTALLALLEPYRAGAALDCGCGAGGNARVLSGRGWNVTAVTISPQEQALAQPHCRAVYLGDLERGLPAEAAGPFDLVLLSHVLEHLREPGRLLTEIRPRLAPGGVVAVALPNVLHWRQRLEFLAGRFEYQAGGIMDGTHLRFYTFDSGRRLIESRGFRIVAAAVEGHVPLPVVRRLLPGMARRADGAGRRRLPGLFGLQSLYLAVPA